MEFTFDYFKDEFNRFWELCGKRSSTVDILLRGWRGLAYVAVNCDGESEKVSSLLMVAKHNLDRRLPYFMLKESPDDTR